MSVYRPSKQHATYVYDFEFNGHRFRGSTFQTNKSAALQVENAKRKEARDRAAGLRPADASDTPTFSAWANVALKYHAQFITRPDILERSFRMVLAFFGARPPKPIGPAAVHRPERAPRPYHDLRLGDPIVDPSWLAKFENWMEARGVSGSTRSSYLSACSDLYTAAMQPQYRAETGIAVNPFAGIRRSPQRTRVVVLSPARILNLVDEAGRHIAQALCIAALAPKLRLASILELRWGAPYFDDGMTTITIERHKTRGTTHAAQVVPISAQLRAILAEIKRAQAAEAVATGRVPSGAVITWRGQPVKTLKTGLRRAVRAVGLTWGTGDDGVTFHVMRHSIATLLANPKTVGALTERLRADVMGHREIRTTQRYTHLDTTVQEGPHEAIAAALPGLGDAIARKRGERRVSR